MAATASAPAQAPTTNVMIGIVCERSVDFNEKLTPEGFLKDDPSVKVIKVPCSGEIQPVMIETALKHGACGVFAMGCRMGDCHYREGNKFLRERLMGTRMPKLKPSVDKRRVQAYWLSAVEYDAFSEMLGEFKQQVAAL
ncbi:MAG: hydrogenase iron-sulfur subunit [Vampirovibrionales bacterium]|nr:hydrogenase iron-sulfur subunit [Vampirovibrionales bacterium]